MTVSLCNDEAIGNYEESKYKVVGNLEKFYIFPSVWVVFIVFSGFIVQKVKFNQHFNECVIFLSQTEQNCTEYEIMKIT